MQKNWLSHIPVTDRDTRNPKRSQRVSKHLKIGGWETILSFWEGLFSGDMLVLGRVTKKHKVGKLQVTKKIIKKDLRKQTHEEHSDKINPVKPKKNYPT